MGLDLVVIENDENPMLPKEEMKELQKEIFLLKNKLKIEETLGVSSVLGAGVLEPNLTIYSLIKVSNSANRINHFN